MYVFPLPALVTTLLIRCAGMLRSRRVLRQGAVRWRFFPGTVGAFGVV